MSDEQEKVKEKWSVIQSEIYPDDGSGCASGMWAAFTVFDTVEEAVAFIENVLRNEWTTTITIPTEDDPYHEEMLADHKGYCYPEDSEKWSDVYYAEDGTKAWQQIGNNVKLIEAVPMKPQGERTSTSC